MLKFALKQSRLNFTKDWLMPESMMQEPEPEVGKDLLTNLLGHDSKDIIDQIILEMDDEEDDDMA